MKKISIKSWALDDRPREKLMLKGKSVLSDAELVAILIGSGNREESAVALSQKILASVNHDLNTLAKLSIEELMEFKGIGEAKAISIITALEFGKRRQFKESNTVSKIKSSLDAATILQPFLGDLEHEEFWVLYLNNSNKILAKHQLSKGGFTATLVDVRLLYQKALKLSAVGIIVSHNHPSGKLSPSKSDIELTNKIKEAGATLDIKLLDHLIITEKTYFSFADEGIL
ncbi:DNA repair protein RadC [Tenacibaculum sp. AHE15PA]|uniref:RadC family protein n=1 Tax=Tenacibaculum TaxID=104267 RepID=UPI001C4E6F88|nr:MULTISPECIES: DNA repair protein RadC [Tenacibaculum]QXP72497.1 DNA repair protein RadC [Tenacibaculum sp. AHE14PA]QXP76413.1 DNA repair protein RadC [Tenacibaculum sp. AHE15PA]